MTEIKFSHTFARKLNTYSKKQPAVYKKILHKIEFFQNHIDHPSLRTHRLKGDMRKYWSFWVEGDLRIIYLYEDTIVSIDIGTHAEVYK